MSGRGRECPDRRPISAFQSDHWLDASANGARHRGHGDQWNALKSWARGFPHMLLLVNCLEKGLAQLQAHERPGGARERVASGPTDAAPATDLILKRPPPKPLFFILSDSFALNRTPPTVSILDVLLKLFPKVELARRNFLPARAPLR